MSSGTKQNFYCCFVDLAKAFDSIPHSTMLIKLLRLNIGGKFFSLMKSMLNNAQSQIKLPDGLTSTFKLGKGSDRGTA